jgi:hypothetical protein
MVRDDFLKGVTNGLRMRAAFICSNPDCRKQTIAPSDEDETKYLYLGKAAHITAAANGGPRYDPNMSPEERRSISNGIFLCSNCADLIDKNKGRDFAVETLKAWKIDHEKWVSANLNKRPGGIGGEGGSGTIIGNRGVVIGGRGGDGGNGGVAGVGGKGGSGFIQGDDGLIIGGDGGSCYTADGRGGRGARGPTERFGFPAEIWGYGRGGAGTNHPEYDRRIQLLTQFRNDYRARFPGDAPYIDAGVDIVPIDWINQRLAECREVWRVEIGQCGYILPALTGYSAQG